MLGKMNTIEAEEPSVDKWRLRFAQSKATVPDDPKAIRENFYVSQKGETRRYYADYQQKSLAITADPKKIRTSLKDRETVAAMLNLAEARGWNSIRVNGSADFKREAWVQASVMGIKVNGYSPTETDRQEVGKRLGERMPSSEQKTKQVDPNEVRLVTDGGWKKVQGGGEQRVLIGQSSAGFHHAVQVTLDRTDPAPPHWSKAYATAKEAKAAARTMPTVADAENIFSRAEKVGAAANASSQAPKQTQGLAA